MRICFVSQEYPPETAHGGIATQTRAKAEGMAARGHDVCVISASVDGKRHDGGSPVRVVRILGPECPVRSEEARWLLWSGEVAREIDSLHQQAPFDVVDFPDYGAEGFAYLLNRHDGDRPATSIHVQGPLIMLERVLGWPPADSSLAVAGTMLERTTVQLADAVYAAGGCSADWVAREYDVSRARIPVLHTGVDTTLFAPNKAERDPHPTILFVSKLARNKGLDVLVRAACRLLTEIPDVRVRIVGRLHDPRLVDEVRAFAAQAGRSDLLEFVGHVSRDELPRELCRAHVLAVPSAYEGGPGFVYLEAMACGTPVIGCTGSGAEEVIRDGDTGLLVPSGNDQALADALKSLLTDRNFNDACGASARRWITEHASTSMCMDAIEQFLLNVSRRRVVT